MDTAEEPDTERAGTKEKLFSIVFIIVIFSSILLKIVP